MNGPRLDDSGGLDVSDSDESIASEPDICRCSMDLKVQIDQLRYHSAKALDQNIKLFENVMIEKPENLCRHHLRRFVKRALGFYNSQKTKSSYSAIGGIFCGT